MAHEVNDKVLRSVITKAESIKARIDNKKKKNNKEKNSESLSRKDVIEVLKLMPKVDTEDKILYLESFFDTFDGQRDKILNDIKSYKEFYA